MKRLGKFTTALLAGALFSLPAAAVEEDLRDPRVHPISLALCLTPRLPFAHFARFALGDAQGSASLRQLALGRGIVQFAAVAVEIVVAAVNGDAFFA